VDRAGIDVNVVAKAADPERVRQRADPSLPLILVGADAAWDRVATGSGNIAQPVDTFGAHRFVWTAGTRGPSAPPPDLHQSVRHGNARALAAGDYAGSHL
jgi:hypothetical protein